MGYRKKCSEFIGTSQWTHSLLEKGMGLFEIRARASGEGRRVWVLCNCQSSCFWKCRARKAKTSRQGQLGPSSPAWPLAHARQRQTNQLAHTTSWWGITESGRPTRCAVPLAL
jgi:hypothetical protein